MTLTAFLAPTLLSGLSDVSVSPGPGQNGYPLTWDNTLGKWVASNVIAGVSIRTGAGSNSQAIGSAANSTGSSWIAQGRDAGFSNTTGINWIAQGFEAGYNNTTGSNWFAQGPLAGFYNSTGSNWIVQGREAGFLNTTGSGWIAQGFGAGFSNTTGSDWIAQGKEAGFSNTTGINWIAQGSAAGYNNTTGSNWIAQGFLAGFYNSTGSNWIAQGPFTGFSNTTGSNWIAQGFEAGFFEERGSTWHVGVDRSKSLVVGKFDTDCVYLGHAGPITNAATCPDPTAAAHLAASNTARASLRIDPGVAPTAPNDGDIWFDGTDFKVRVAGVTKTIQVI